MSENLSEKEKPVSTPPEVKAEGPGQDLAKRFEVRKEEKKDEKPAEVVGQLPEVFYCEEPGCGKSFTDRRKYKDHVRYHKNAKEDAAAKAKKEKPVKTVASVKVEGGSTVKLTREKSEPPTPPAPDAKAKPVKEEKSAAKGSGVAPLAILGLFGLVSLGLIFMSMRKKVEMTAGPVSVKVEDHEIKGTVQARQPEPEQKPESVAPVELLSPLGINPALG